MVNQMSTRRTVLKSTLGTAAIVSLLQGNGVRINRNDSFCP